MLQVSMLPNTAAPSASGGGGPDPPLTEGLRGMGGGVPASSRAFRGNPTWSEGRKYSGRQRFSRVASQQLPRGRPRSL